MKAYQNYLFDADGTLIDTVELIYQSFLYVFQKFGGISINKQRIISDMGLPLLEMMGAYFPNLSDGDLVQITDVYRDYQLEIYHEFLALFPGVRHALAALKNQGKKLAVVTSRKEDTASLYLEYTNILKFFDVVVTPESTRRHKPHPEPALKALKLLRGRTSESVFIGDSAYDIQCGCAAGMDTVFVEWSQSDSSTFEIASTLKIMEMKDLLTFTPN